MKQKRLSRTTPIPCIVRTEGLAEEDSLAENVQRAPLHPLDQFRAFLAMREKGMTEEDIAAALFVSAQVVKQRLKLASVSSKLLDIYAEDGMTLDQLMAFTVNPDHERQESVWEALQRSHSKEPYHIRRLLTEGAVRASDKRAQFVGIDAYQAAGGTVKGVRIVAETGRTNEDAPTHRIFVGRAEIGAAWAKSSEKNEEYHSLKLDDPSFTAPVYANLVKDKDGETYSAIWSRRPGKRNGD